MRHEELRDRLLDLAYGELSPRDAHEVEAHAASCEACRAELARLRGTRALMAQLPDEPAPEGGERILVAAAREAVRGRERRRLPRWLWAAPLAAASLAAVVALSLRLGAVSPPSREDPDALLGRSPYAQAPEARQPAPGEAAPAQAAPAAAPTPPGGASAGSDRSASAAAAAAARDEQERTRAAQREQRPAPAERRRAPAAAAPTFATAPEEPNGGQRGAGPPAAAPSPRAAAPAPPPSAGLAAPGAASALRAPTAGAPAPAEAQAEAAPERRAAKANAARPQAAARDEALPSDAGADAVARHDELRRAGRLRAEFRAFPGCPQEPWRRLERDPDGRVVSYAWETLEGGRLLRREVLYAPDGRVAQRRATDVATGAPRPATFAAPRASAVDLDAPTACER